MPYYTESRLVKDENPNFKCRKCGSNDTLTYRKWESSDGAHDDLHYECGCGYSWWVEGADY